MTRDRKLAELAEIAVGVRFGMAAFDDRLGEMSAGIPARGSGPGSKGDISDPTFRAVDKPGKTAVSDFDRKLHVAHAAVKDLLQSYDEVAVPKRGLERLSDPGCEWCTQAAKAEKSPKPDHRCDVYGHIELDIDGKKTRVRVCEWCYRFWLPSRAGRKPTIPELWAHAQGRRVYLKPVKVPKMRAAKRLKAKAS